MAKNHSYDFVVFGATSFVGQILTRYLAGRHPVGGDIRWAIAGRSGAKLESLRESLGDAAKSLEILIADSNDADSLTAMCQSARVIVSTVGPYALYGEPLIKACVETGTDYCDLTGEVQWIKRMIDKYEQQARESGARIVHCCGFDSIPSDLGVWFLQGESRRKFGKPCQRVKMRVKAAKGGISGGTAASMVNVFAEAVKDPALRKELGDPYSICPPSHKPGVRQPDVKTPEFDEDFNAWAGPFIMAVINTRIVHRTNALLNASYGKDFEYDEAALVGKGFKGRLTGLGFSGALGAFAAAAALKPTRWLLEKYALPKPGEGPSEAQQNGGYYDLRFVGKTPEGQSVRVKVTGDRDPGYGSTGKMLGEATVCLAMDFANKDGRGGFWTPASLMGGKLVERLTASAGLTFEVLETKPE